jgi:hypothetical protein
MDRFAASSTTYQQTLIQTAKRYDMYRGFYQGKYHPFRNNVHLPLLLSSVQADVAHKTATSFGVWPFVEMEGYSPDDAGTARKNTILISAQMKDDDTFRKSVDFFTSGDIYGTAILMCGWKYSQDQRLFKEEFVNNYAGVRKFYKRKEVVTTFDGPNWEVVDILDFFPQPGVKEVRDMHWCIRRIWIDLDDVRAMGASGVYDKKAVAELEKGGGAGWTGASSAWQGYQDRIRSFRSFIDQDLRSGEDPTDRPVEILEMWGTLPDELVPSDGIKNRVITVANGTYVLRNEPNPYWHGQLPFLTYCPIPDPHYFYGIGKVEIGEKMQAAANRFTNQKLDALDLTVDPVMLYDKQRFLDPRKLYMRAGRAIGVDGPVDDSALRPLFPDLRGMQQADVQVEQLWRWIQQGLGQVEDTTMGTAKAGGRQTAREFLGRQENITTRLLLETRIAEEGWIEPLANLFRKLNQQYLTTPHEIRIAGKDAIINSITGEKLEPEDRTVELEDLYQDYDVRAKGATQMLSKGAQQQNMANLIQMMGTNPAAAQYVNWVAMLRHMFKIFEFSNQEELLNTPEEMLQMNQAALGVAPPGGGGGPEGAPVDPTQMAIAEMLSPAAAAGEVG